MPFRIHADNSHMKDDSLKESNKPFQQVFNATLYPNFSASD